MTARPHARRPSPPGAPVALPVVGAPVVLRRDAARNRERILEAARGLFAHRTVDSVDVREIARVAGVGLGTVYRAFGDKGRLIAELLDDHERELQDRLLSGPPPLGPGAPAAERLAAFLDALAELTFANLPLLAASESSAPGARYRIGAFGAWRLHVGILLSDAAPDLDHVWFSESLLAPLAADLVTHQRAERELSLAELKRNLARSVSLLLAGSRPRG